VPAAFSDFTLSSQVAGAYVLEDDVDAFEIRDLTDFLRNLLLIVIDERSRPESRARSILRIVAGRW